MPGKVYVSYAWKVERENGIVAKLEAACQARGVELHRDIKNIRYGQSIREFMDQLTVGDHVVLVLSDAYFRSSDCMYELKGIYERSQGEKAFRQRVHPIVAEGTRFRKVRERTPYLRHWEEEIAATKNDLETIDRTYTQESQRELDDYAEFRRLIDTLLPILGDMNTLIEGVHVDSDFAALLDRIAPVAANQPPALIRHRVSDDEFQQSLRAEIRCVLKSRPSLANAVKDDFANLPAQKVTEDWIPCLWQQPIEQVVDVVLRPATMRVLAGTSDRDFDLLWDDAKRLFYCLLLLSVDPEWVKQTEDAESPGDFRFDVFVQTLGGVEVASARYRQQNIELSFAPGTPDVYGPGSVKPPAFETGWSDDQAVDGLVVEIWNRVFPNKRTDQYLSPQQLKQLQKRLADCERFRTDHFYVSVDGVSDGRWSRRDLYAKVLEKLPSVTVIWIQSSADRSVLQVSDEAIFMVSVLGFLEIPASLRKGRSH